VVSHSKQSKKLGASEKNKQTFPEKNGGRAGGGEGKKKHGVAQKLSFWGCFGTAEARGHWEKRRKRKAPLVTNALFKQPLSGG